MNGKYSTNIEEKDLKIELEKLRDINNTLVKNNELLRALTSEKFENTKLYTSMFKENQKVHKLDNENKRLKSQIKGLNKTIEEQSKSIQKLFNENESLLEKVNTKSGIIQKNKGGRPTKFNKDIIMSIKEEKKTTNASYKELAVKYNCSIGLIHKVVNEK